jgi:exodeoxyribonuclease V gamma subunit
LPTICAGSSCLDLSADYALSQDRMLWRIVSLLPGLLGEPDFAPIKAYLKDGDTLKLIQLAEKIAYHFDQYLIFRPHWSGQWEQGRPGGDLRESQHLAAEAWQSRLWREVAEGFETEHRAALLKRAMDALRQGRNEESLPKRLCVFGISTLPPSYLDLLLAVSRHVPVHIFLLSPCSQYWGDLAGKREQIRDYRQLAQSGVKAQSRPEDAIAPGGPGTVGTRFSRASDHGGRGRIATLQFQPKPGHPARTPAGGPAQSGTDAGAAQNRAARLVRPTALLSQPHARDGGAARPDP